MTSIREGSQFGELSPAYPDYIDGRSVPFGGSLLLRNSSLTGGHRLDSEAWSGKPTPGGN